MKVRLSELPAGSCFKQGAGTRKKVSDSKAAVVGPNGRVRTRQVRGDPEVEPTPCPLRYLGVGLRRHPETVVEVGDGNLLQGGRRRIS